MKERVRMLCVCVRVCMCVCVCACVEMWRVRESRRVHRRTKCHDEEWRNIHSAEHLEGNRLCEIARRRHGRGNFRYLDIAESGPSRLFGKKEKKEREIEKQRERSLADDDALDPSE